ncbi:MAG: c-type cytochrome [Acidimicrobiales bacterium]
MRSLRPAVVAIVLVLTVVVSGVVAACGSSSAGPTPSDPVLATGQQVYKAHCQTCHGSKGQGGTGMKLAGKVATDFPNIDDQIAVIANGRSSMPAWKNSLSADEITAVARYERECLGTTC